MESNALQFTCPTCGARPGLKCFSWMWNTRFMNSVFTESDDVHRTRKIEAAKAVTKRLQGNTLPEFQFGFTGWKETA